MVRLPLLVFAALFAVPAFAASDVWRWRDPAGRLHYSNIPERLPADAERVETQLGYVSSTGRAPAATKVRDDLERREDIGRERPRRWREGGSRGWAAMPPAVAYGCCAPFGLQHILTTTGRSLADQVQEASLLDALNVRWRQPFCP